MLQDPRLCPWSLLPSFPRGQGQLMTMMLGDFDDNDVWWQRWFLRGQDELIQLDLIDSVGTEWVKEKE